ncbi:MAG: heavy-metal-associated domain-containing protein [Candidatus Nanopelagicaceae bacterium]|jgi:copper chaperone CopZ
MSEQNWKATGLTCNHCAQSVTKNLMSIDGMSSVDVEVKPNEVSSILTVGARDFTPEEISRAMAQAGKYVLTS